MRKKLTRVNIILSKDQHERFKEYAKRYHGSLSQFLRLAGENEIDNQEDTTDFHFRPIIELEEKNHQVIQKIEKQIKSLKTSSDFASNASHSKKAIIADGIEQILLHNENSLTVPEIQEYLSYSSEDLILGIEWLLDHKKIEQIERINAPSKWSIKGGGISLKQMKKN
jgi:hypothetical protein